ncbi:MAG: serine/threonine protein kinase [Planctomycetota bacterium]|jgi:serine/threonine-protein kinase
MADEDKFSFPHVAIAQGLLTADQFRHCRQVQEDAIKEGGKPDVIEIIAVRCGFMNDREVHAVNKAIERYKKDSIRESELKISGFDIIEKIGEGGLGIVYKARQISMGRMVALKVLHPQWVEDEEFRKRFLLEARIVGKLSHNNLIQVFDVGKERGRYYFSMEFIDGETVEDILDILMDSARNAKLGDFGFVKSQSDLEKELGTEGMVLGTPDYIAPEQAMGDDVDYRSDIYALGATLYHMVTGSPPFDGTSSSVMEKHIRARIPDPREHRPDIPDPLVHIIEKMMAKRLDDRYEDFRDLFEDLDLVKAGMDPQTERLEAGKSTIFRAFRIEKDRIEEIKSERRRLEKRVQQLQYRIFILLVAVSVTVTACLVMALLFFGKL